MKPSLTLHARTKAYAKDHPLKSWWCIFSSTFYLVVGMVLTLPWLWLTLPGWLALAARIAFSIVSGLLIVRLFVIYHDQQHRAILPRSRPAELYMRIFGIWVLCPSSIWRSSHDYHHAHNSKLRSAYIGSYPVMTKEQYAVTGRLDRFKYLFMRHPLTILFGYVFVFLFSMVILPVFKSPRKHYDCILSFLLHFAFGAALVLMFGWGALVLTIIVPFSIASALGAYLFYAQHNFPNVTYKDKCGWTYEGAALESSSYLKTNPVMAWFTANIGYHHIHHLNHRIPFYRLPEIYQDIPELRTAKTTTLSPLDIFRCLRLKVWDVEAQRMVGVRGL